MEEEKTPLERFNDAIATQTAGTSAHNVFILEFDGIPLKKLTLEMKQRIERFNGIQMISMVNCELESLENFPNLPHLIRVDLVANEIQGKDLPYLSNSRQLQTVILSHNSIQNLEDLKHLQIFKSMLYLDLFGNPVNENSEAEEYKKFIFGCFKQLQILDSEDKTGNFADQKMDEILQRVASSLLERQKPSKAQAQVIKRISSSHVVLQNQVQAARQASQQNVQQQQQQQQQKKKKKEPVQPATNGVSKQQQQKQQRKEPVQRAQGGKGGKGKMSYKVKQTTSSRSGLTFPCGRIGRYLKEQNRQFRVSAMSKIYMGAVLEYLCAEVMELAGMAAKANKKRRIIPIHIRNAMRTDEEISKFVDGFVIAEGGSVTSNCDQGVLNKLFSKKSKASSE